MGDSVTPGPELRHRTGPGSRFYVCLPEVSALLQRDRRVTYRWLSDVFGRDEILEVGCQVAMGAYHEPTGCYFTSVVY